jgi:hypothetical protein
MILIGAIRREPAAGRAAQGSKVESHAQIFSAARRNQSGE